MDAPLTAAEVETALAIVANREMLTFNTLADEMVRNTATAASVRDLRGELDRLKTAVVALISENERLDAELRNLAAAHAGIESLRNIPMDAQEARIVAWLMGRDVPID